jgi:hypothetical protein
MNVIHLIGEQRRELDTTLPTIVSYVVLVGTLATQSRDKALTSLEKGEKPTLSIGSGRMMFESGFSELITIVLHHHRVARVLPPVPRDENR